MNSPRLEALEGRDLLSVTSVLSGGILTLTGDPGSPHNVLIRPTANVPGSTDVVADGVTTLYSSLTRVNYTEIGANTATPAHLVVFTNRVATLPGTIQVGTSNSTIYTIAPNSTVLAGNGNDVIQATGGKSTITVGNGNDSVYGGVGDTISVGSGNDVVYDILPGTTTVNVAAHTGIDHLFTGPQTTLKGALPQDHVAQFFVAAPQGSGKLVQSGHTLYFAANNNGDQLISFGNSSALVVVYNLNDGTGFHSSVFKNVLQIAAFGGTGNDTFINNSTVDDAMYGAGGSNTLIGGFGSLDLEKAGGAAATGSITIGRSPTANDLNLSGLTATSNTAIFAGGPTAHNIVRTNSPTDLIVGLHAGDTLVSLYPDLVSASSLPPFVAA